MKKCIICDYDLNNPIDCDNCYAYIIDKEIVGYNINGNTYNFLRINFSTNEIVIKNRHEICVILDNKNEIDKVINMTNMDRYLYLKKLSENLDFL